MENKKSKAKYYFIYTLLFIICCLLCFYTYYSNNLSFIYDGDGWSQHYKAYIYYGEYLRELFRNIFINHTFEIPQWDFSIGEGADILGTFSYYVMGDPITLLCVFVPSKYMYIFYNISIILRLYLAGFVFSLLCFRFTDNKTAVLGGALSYVFCFWSLFNSVRHIYFLNPMIYFPLVVMGIEKVINNENPLLLTISVLISSISNFYFFYNIVLLTVIYVVVRLIYLYSKDIKILLNKLLLIFKYSLFGVLIAAVLLLPILNFYLQDSRLSIDFGKHLTYPLNYYLKLPSMFLSTSREYWLCMGYASPVLLALITSIFNWKNNKFINCLNVIGILMILFPLFGQIMNGFSYISNKWCFGLSLLMSYSLTKQWDEIKNLKVINFICLALLLGACVVLGLGLNLYVPIIIALIFLLVSCFISKNNKYILIPLIIICISFNAYNQYSESGSNYASYATTYEEDKNILESSEAYYFSEYIEDKDDSFFRYSGTSITQNAAILFNTHSVDYYWSLGNGSISEYRNIMEVDEYLLQKFYGYSNNFILNTLANVKYYLTQKDYDGVLPYGFVKIDSFDSYDLYINEYNLPFGYTYEEAISYDDWNKLSTVEKQELLTKQIVIDEGEDNIANLSTREVNYEIEEVEGLKIEDNKVVVDSEDAYILIRYDDATDGEIYLSIKGLKYKDNKNWLKDPNDASSISIEANNVNKYLSIYSNDSRYYNGREDFTFDLGLSSSNNTIKISFGEIGIYGFDNIIVSCLPLNEYKEDIEKLKSDTFDELSFDTNTISGTIDLDDDKYLLLTIPYSKGWTAYVDGVETDLLNANVSYTALKLCAGKHEIVLKYSTPYLKEGLIISCVGILLYVVDYLIKKRKHEG